MVIIAKACVELIAAILLYLSLITAKSEGLSHVYNYLVAIAILAFIAGFAWWFC